MDATPPVETEIWASRDAEALYHVDGWGGGYFAVNDEGHVVVRPIRGADDEVDLYEVVAHLNERGVRLPLLLRLQDVLRSRIEHLNESFRTQIEALDYKNDYIGIFPIKVNQLREVVEEVLDAGAPYACGLECGSKAELAAALPYMGQHDRLLLCNGVKDMSMMRLLITGQRLGRQVLPVLERMEEYEMLRTAAEEAGVAADFGVRVRLSTHGAGLWSESGGENSKFGISLTELLTLVERLQEGGREQDLKLLHFHLGSQIADLESVRQAIQEIAQVYAWLIGKGVGVEYVDVGGGLGVNYEADNPEALGYINYDVDAYAAAVVGSLAAACDAASVPHPRIISESGRALSAHHSVLIVPVLGVRTKRTADAPPSEDIEHPLVERLAAVLDAWDTAGTDGAGIDRRYSDLQAIRADGAALFRQGRLSLEQKALLDRLFWHAFHRLWASSEADGTRPGPVKNALEDQFVDHYLCDFSVFRSMVDHWAIGQRFPIMPLHRLNEQPRRRGRLVDLTCDSDGQVKRFVSREGDRRHLELHSLRNDEPYYIGCFLMGAYQDVMGDMHNLFGRVTEAHIYVDADEPRGFRIEELLPGHSVRGVLGEVQYYAHELDRRMSDMIQSQVRADRIRPSEAVRLLEQYRDLLDDYTYLDPDSFLTGHE